MTTHRVSMNEVTTFRWSFEEDIWHYVEAGYEGIGVWRQKIADFGEERGVDLVAESGLSVTNLQWAGGFTGSEGRSLEESIDDAAQAVRLAGALDAGCLLFYTGGRNNHTFRHAERLLSTAIDQLLPLAEAADVTLAIEPMHPSCAEDWTFLTDLVETLSLLSRYESRHLKLVLDLYHFGEDPYLQTALPRIIPHVAVVQLGDRRGLHSNEQNRCPLGEGKLPLGDLVRLLIESGYQGDFDVELVGQDLQLCQYEELLECSKNWFEGILTPVQGR